MKATILVPFRDKHDHKVVYAPGEVKDFDNDRVVALAARGLVKPLESPDEAIEKVPDIAEAEAEVKPAKNKGKTKGKSSKKDKDADITSESGKEDVANADTDTPTDKE